MLDTNITKKFQSYFQYTQCTINYIIDLPNNSFGTIQLFIHAKPRSSLICSYIDYFLCFLITATLIIYFIVLSSQINILLHITMRILSKMFGIIFKCSNVVHSKEHLFKRYTKIGTSLKM